MFSIRPKSPVKMGSIATPTFCPDHCMLRSGDRPPYVFPFLAEQGWLFVQDMVSAGWVRTDSPDTVILTAPQTCNVVPFKRVAP